jgi:hypothetical protein
MAVLRRRTRSYGHGEPEPLDLRETNLSGVDLSGVNLWEANLTGAKLFAARFLGANLTGADLRGRSLTEAQLGKTTGDKSTQLPPHLNPPAHWDVKTGEQTEEH